MCQYLAKEFKIPFVSEYAREYLERKKGSYSIDDLIEIGKEQIKREDSVLNNFEQDLVLIDTDLITLKIWSLDKFGTCDKWILDQIESRQYDLYILCKPDLPWSPDPLRENPTDRGRLYKWYRRELNYYKKNFVELSGLGDQRRLRGRKFVENHFDFSSY